MDDKNIKAGATIHSGDGGYGIGTQENYNVFVKIRNQSLTITKPAQKPWVGLTYEDMTSLQKDLHDSNGEIVLPTTFAKAVEAKLKEKNT